MFFIAQILNFIIFILYPRLNPQSGEDELTACMKRQLCFAKFTEQKINFMPTYKFNPGTSIYDTSKLLRQPSYTVSHKMNYLRDISIFRIEYYTKIKSR